MNLLTEDLGGYSLSPSRCCSCRPGSLRVSITNLVNTYLVCMKYWLPLVKVMFPISGDVAFIYKSEFMLCCVNEIMLLFGRCITAQVHMNVPVTQYCCNENWNY